MWCLITSSQLKVPLAQRGRLRERTLELLREDHQRFLPEVGGDHSKAKLYNNVIGGVELMGVATRTRGRSTK